MPFFQVLMGYTTKTVHVLGHKASVNKFKIIEITRSMFSDQNRSKLEIDNIKVTWKIHTYLEIKKHFSKLMGQ